MHSRIRDFLSKRMCISTPLDQAARMVAVIEGIFAFGFACHGGYMSATGGSNLEKIYGGMYVFSGITYWTLAWLLWMASEKPTLLRCRNWILSSILNQLLIIALTVARTITESKKFWSGSNIWIISGLFLQCYLVAVVWGYMVDVEHSEENESKFKNSLEAGPSNLKPRVVVD